MLEFIESSEKLDLYKKADGTFILTEIYDYDEEINEDIDSDVILTIADEYKVNNLNRVFEKFDKDRFYLEDITDDVLSGDHTEKDYKNVEDYVIELFDIYLEEFLTKDMVLDKINKFGIESLKEIDIKVLES